MRGHFWIPAVLGCLAVLLGAFGAHGLEGRIDEHAIEIWEKANRYHFLHVLAILALTVAELQGCKNTKFIVGAWSMGILFFSGGLYLYALTGIKFGALLAPIGGLTFAAGWLSLLRVEKP